MKLISGSHEAAPRPGTARRVRDGQPARLTRPSDYPVFARCTGCDGLIRCDRWFRASEWYHVTDGDDALDDGTSCGTQNHRCEMPGPGPVPGAGLFRVQGPGVINQTRWPHARAEHQADR